jgi:hypothetical protein
VHEIIIRVFLQGEHRGSLKIPLFARRAGVCTEHVALLVSERSEIVQPQTLWFRSAEVDRLRMGWRFLSIVFVSARVREGRLPNSWVQSTTDSDRERESSGEKAKESASEERSRAVDDASSPCSRIFALALRPRCTAL